MDAFDADVLIYATAVDSVPGAAVRALFPTVEGLEAPVGIGSVLLVTEVLAKPMREGWHDDLEELGALLARLDLRPVDRSTAEVAAGLSATYRLHAVDAVHLATAVVAGADRFLTNNRRDFGKAIAEIDVTYPEDLAG